MSLPNDEFNAELEQLIIGARPQLDARSREQLIFAAGRAAGLEEAQAVSRSAQMKTRWTSVATHVLCSLAAGWLALAIVPTFYKQPTKSSPSDSVGAQQLAQQGQPIQIKASPIDSNSSEDVPAASSEILRLRTRPEKFVRLLNQREGNTVAVAPKADDEPILSARSILF